MTTFTGKDVTIKYDVDADNVKETLGLAQEISVEVDNGRQDTKEIGTDTIVDFNWVGVAVSGSLTIVPQDNVATTGSFGDLFDLIRPTSGNPSGNRTGADDDMIIELYDGTGTYTVTITGIAFGSMGFTGGLEEVITFELPFVGKDIAYSYA
jgi:hypothetical protein